MGSDESDCLKSSEAQADSVAATATVVGIFRRPLGLPRKGENGENFILVVQISRSKDTPPAWWVLEKSE